MITTQRIHISLTHVILYRFIEITFRKLKLRYIVTTIYCTRSLGYTTINIKAKHFITQENVKLMKTRFFRFVKLS